jgi:hypothetical protein
LEEEHLETGEMYEDVPRVNVFFSFAMLLCLSGNIKVASHGKPAFPTGAPRGAGGSPTTERAPGGRTANEP